MALSFARSASDSPKGRVALSFARSASDSPKGRVALNKRAVLGGALAVLVWVSPAFGDGTERERAQRSFDAGRAHAAKGQCDLAVEDFKSTIEYEPKSIGARLNLGDCYSALGRLAEAFKRYREAEALAVESNDKRDLPRLEEARQSAARVEAKLVHVVVRDDDPSAALTVDGAVTARPFAVVVDPNVEHVLEAVAPDGRRWKQRLKGKPGESLKVAIVLKGPDKAPAEERPVEPVPPPPVQHRSERSSLATAGLVVGGVGVAAVVAGAVVGGLALARRSDLADAVKGDARCRGGYPGSCTEDAKADIQPFEDRAYGVATTSTVLFVAGGLLAAAGVAMFVLAPTVRVRVGTGAAIEGSF